MNRWMLPDGMDELLPPASWRLEALRHSLLSCYRDAQYELVFPPMVEHLDTLLTGAGADLEAQTFKLTDPQSGRLLGLRSDMTPQAARIAARRYGHLEVVRLCYLGTVLHTVPAADGGPRSPRQVGCELFGEATLGADFEVMDLMLRTLQLAGVSGVHLDLGHVGVYRALVGSLGLGATDEATLFGILQRKSRPDLADFGRSTGLGARLDRLSQLMLLNGDGSVIATARERLPADPEIVAALDALDATARHLGARHPGLPLHVDLAELRGSRYHTGLVFAAFAPGLGREIARGGRYDGVGAEFGRARPATGFSADINELLALGSAGK